MGVVLPLHSDRLSLRRLTPDDLHRFLDYRNDPAVSRYQGWDGFTVDQAAELLRTQAVQEAGVPGQWFQIGIARRENNHLLGDCGLKIHAHDPRQATIGITLARASQRLGYATEVLSMLFDHVFGPLHLHRVIADTDPENVPSWRLLERLEMRREAHSKRSLWFKGRWADEYVYAILADEWLSRGDGASPLST
jgi:[ribosomal protein S5]-alanine N-acetyltransferase